MDNYTSKAGWPYVRSYYVKAFRNGEQLGISEAYDREHATNLVNIRMKSSAANRITVVDTHSKAILEDWRLAYGRWRRENESMVAKYE